MLKPAANKGEPFVVASTSGVSTRKGPGTGYAKLGALGIGSVATVTKRQGQWGYVSAAQPGDGTWGTTIGVWINLEPCVPGLPTRWVVTTPSTLNLREKADAASRSLAKLPKDTKLTVTAIEKKSDYTWGFVAYAKDPSDVWYMREGWVALEYCKQLG